MMTKTSAVSHLPSAIKISVIIPIYNVEQYLRRCLDSLLAQTFSDWEAICVNDGSPDNSAAILDEYAAMDSRIQIVTKPNGGLSDARNVGMERVAGEYVLYLDSDDFIHPQTMELTYNLACRDKSDIVAFTYDRAYRPRLIVRHFLGMATNNIVPWGIKKKYDIKKIETKFTENILDYATEKSHGQGKWAIKHCQVWKNLYRHELIKDIPFIKGLLFEDLPWWSAVMLRRPRTTITKLPLYFYIPNFGGISLSARQFRIMNSLCAGISDAYAKYKESATNDEMRLWSSNFKWPFLAHAFGKVAKLDNCADIDAAKKVFSDLNAMGVLADAIDCKTYNKIMEFICR